MNVSTGCLQNIHVICCKYVRLLSASRSKQKTEEDEDLLIETYFSPLSTKPVSFDYSTCSKVRIHDLAEHSHKLTSVDYALVGYVRDRRAFFVCSVELLHDTCPTQMMHNNTYFQFLCCGGDRNLSEYAF